MSEEETVRELSPSEILAERVDSLEKQRHEFLAATVEHVRGWYQEEADEAAAANPGRIIELGKRRVRRMHKAIRRLERRAPKIVKKRLGHDQYWAHLAKDPIESVGATTKERKYINPYRIAEDAIPPALHVPWGFVLTPLGRLLMRRGLADGVWAASGKTSGLTERRRPAPISPGMKDALDDYADGVDELFTIATKAAVERADERMQRAAELWGKPPAEPTEPIEPETPSADTDSVSEETSGQAD